MGRLLDAFGRAIGLGPRPKISQFTDPSQKIFEGPVKVTFYNDRLVAKGICFHCKSKIEYQLMLTKSQAAATSRDQQYRKNLYDLAGDFLQRDHQCALLGEGKDTVEDLHREIEREARQA